MGFFRTVQMLAHVNSESWENRMSLHFFILPQTAPQILCIAGHYFLLPLVAAPHTTIPDPRVRARGSRVSETIRRSAPSARQSEAIQDCLISVLNSRHLTDP